MALLLAGRQWRAWRRRWHAAVLSALRSPPTSSCPSPPALCGVPDEAEAPLLSAVYGWAIARKRRRETTAPERVAPASVPVLSVGNFTFGATGKTPLVLLLVALALRHGGPRRVPLLLSRVSPSIGRSTPPIDPFTDPLLTSCCLTGLRRR
jgi:hypothetical protein